MVVQSRTHFTSSPRANDPLVPFLLKARISLAPTHFANQTALPMGIHLLRHWSRSTLPRIPCGMVRLSLRNGTDGLARSRNQASLLLSVNVTRGGGLKVDADATLLWACLFSIAAAKTDDSTCKPERCFSWAYRDGRAVFDSFCDTCVRS